MSTGANRKHRRPQGDGSAQQTQATERRMPSLPLSEAVNPVARLVGHSLAAAIGFALMALVALIPLGTLKLLEAAGVDTLKQWMEPGELVLLYADTALSGVVFLAGVLHFLLDLYVDFERRIIATWNRRKHHDGI